MGGNINSPTDNTFCEKFQMLKAIENEIFVVKHTCHTTNLHKNMASSGKNDGRTKLGFFRILHELIFVDFWYVYMESLNKRFVKRKILLQAF